MNSNEHVPKDRENRDGGVGVGAGLWEHDGVPGDPELEQALRNFRSSVHAWSDAEYQQPRLVAVAPRRLAWRKAAAWALGSVLMAGGVGGGLLGYRYQQEQARISAAREAEHHRQIQRQQAIEAERELAQVDSDVSREVPTALEPLGQLMPVDEIQ